MNSKHGRSVEILSAYVLLLMGVLKYSMWKNLFVKCKKDSQFAILLWKISAI